MLPMAKVLAGGVFDHLHPGHEYFLRKASELGDELIVMVANDSRAEEKGAHQNQENRAETVRETGIADQVFIGQKKRDFLETVKKHEPDIIALGYDQKIPVKKEKLRKLGVEVKRIDKLKDYSSSKIRKKVEGEGGKIKIIGVSHISPESIEEVRNKIKQEKPECVAVELDRNRLEALKRGETINLSAVKHIGFKNYLIAKFMSVIQKYLGKKTGVIPGQEMLTAVNTAVESEADVALIDRNLKVTLDRLKKIPLLEKIKLFLSIFKRAKVKEFDLNKVPPEKVIELMVNEVKKISPELYRVMVEERNKYMAQALFSLSKRYDKIIAVVGAGHKKGIKKLLRKLNS